MHSFRHLLVLAVAVTPLAASAATPKKCALRPLDVELLEKATKRIELDAGAVSRAVTRGRKEDLSVDRLLDAGGGRTVAIWSSCAAGRCGAWIAMLAVSKKSGKLRMTARSLMPFDETPFEPLGGVEFRSVAIADVDGDRDPELLVEYGFSGTPEPAVGSRAWGYLGIWNLPSLRLAWYGEIWRGGDAGVHENCIPKLRWTGPKCGKKATLTLQRTCGTGYCFTEDDEPAEECDMDLPKAGPLRTFTWRAAQDVFWPAGKTPPKPLDDGRPWLVIALSYPVTGPASGKPEATRDALKAAGFADAEILDSGRLKKLACCYRAVVAGRFATKEAAQARLKALKAKKFAGAYVKKGF